MSRAIKDFEVSVHGSSLFVTGLHQDEGHDSHISLFGLATDDEVEEIANQLEAIFGPLREKARRIDLQEVIDLHRRGIEDAEERLRRMGSPTSVIDQTRSNDEVNP